MRDAGYPACLTAYTAVSQEKGYHEGLEVPRRKHQQIDSFVILRVLGG